MEPREAPDQTQYEVEHSELTAYLAELAGLLGPPNPELLWEPAAAFDRVVTANRSAGAATPISPRSRGAGSR